MIKGEKVIKFNFVSSKCVLRFYGASLPVKYLIHYAPWSSSSSQHNHDDAEAAEDFIMPREEKLCVSTGPTLIELIH